MAASLRVGLVLLLLCSSAAWASSSGVRGLVRAETGRVLDGVEVAVLHENGTRWTTSTTDGGEFRVPDLPPGRYQITVDAGADFEPVVRTIVLREGRWQGVAITLRFTLKDNAHANVTVRASQIDASVGVTFTREDIATDALMNGGAWQAFQSTAPGIVFTEATFTGAEVSAVGQQRAGNRASIDGISVDLHADVFGLTRRKSLLTMAGQSGSHTILAPLLAIESLDVRTINAPIEQRLGPGATTTIVTRSGTDRLTMNLTGEWRPSALMAQDWFEPARGTAERTTYSTAGAAIGGPIRRTRAYYLFAGETQRIIRSQLSRLFVPSAGARAAASPGVRRVLDSLPVANGPFVDAAAIGEDVPERFFALRTGRVHATSDLRVLSGRVDVNASERDRVFGRVNTGASGGPQRDPFTHTQPELFHRGNSTQTTTVTVGVSSRWRLLANEWRLNFSAHDARTIDGPAVAAGGRPIPFDVLAPGADPADTFVSLSYSSVVDGLLFAGRPRGAYHTQWQTTDTLSWTHREHGVQLGMQFRRLSAGTTSARTRLMYSFESPQALMDGRLQSLVIEDRAQARTARDLWSTFVQHRFRVSENVSAEWGLRIGEQGPPRVLGTRQPVLVRHEALPQLERLPAGAPFWRTRVEFAPQASVAYRLTDKRGKPTVIRAGVSVAHDDIGGPSAASLSDATPFYARRAVLSDVFPVPIDTLATAPPLVPEQQGYYSFSDATRSPRTRLWSLTVDRDIGPVHVLTLSYVGARGAYQSYDHGFDYFSPQPIRVEAFSSIGESSYHGLLTQLMQRRWRGVEGRLTWTWSHAIDLDSGEFQDFLPAPQFVDPRAQRGDADFDRRHVVAARVSYEPVLERLRALVGQWCEGWQFDVMGRFQSGAPFSVLTQQRFPYGVRFARPDVVPGVALWVDDRSSSTGRRLNADAFRTPAEPRQGTLRRNTFRSSSLRQIDLAVSRSVRITPRLALHVRLEAFNVFNIVNFGLPDPFLRSPSFGMPSSSYAEGLGGRSFAGGGLDPVLQPGGPRAIQVVARLDY